MSEPARFKQIDLERALKAAKKAGFENILVRVGSDGKLDIVVGPAANDARPAAVLR